MPTLRGHALEAQKRGESVRVVVVVVVAVVSYGFAHSNCALEALIRTDRSKALLFCNARLPQTHLLGAHPTRPRTLIGSGIVGRRAGWSMTVTTTATTTTMPYSLDNARRL